MAWSLRVYDETGIIIQKTITSADVVPAIHGGFRVTQTSAGDCVSFQFRGRNDMLGIKPRQIVQFIADGQNLFWGPITRCPNLGSQGAGFDDGAEADLEEFVAEGGRVLIAACSSGARYVESSEEVADIFKEFLYLYGPPALRTQLGDITDTLSVLSLFYKPNSQLDVLLDELVETVPGWVWGVNANGRVFLKELTGILAFEADALVDFAFRPVESESVVTKVNLVVSGAPAGRVPDVEDFYHNDPTLYDAGVGAESARVLYDYVPVPIVFTYEDPLHSVYNAERSFALPEGITPFLDPPTAATHVGKTLDGWTDYQNMYDNDADTFAYTDSTSWPLSWWLKGTLASTLPAGVTDVTEINPMVGFRLVYSAQFAAASYASPDKRAHPRVLFHQGVVSGPNEHYTPWPDVDYGTTAQRYFVLRSTYDSTNSIVNKDAMYSVAPLPAHAIAINRDSALAANGFQTEVSMTAYDVVGRSKIYFFYPLVLDTSLLTEIAKSNISVPNSMSGDVVVQGYSPVVPVVQVNNLFGIPVGDPPSTTMTEAVEMVEYLLTPETGFVTRYTMGNDDVSAAGKLLQRYVRDGVTAANYALTMG